MLQSELFSKTSRTVSDEETSKNATLLLRAGFISRLMAGVYTMLPLGLRVLRNIETIIREEMNAAGGQEMLMPSLQPKANWEKTDRWDHLDTLFRFTSHYTKTEYALGPTHEEIVSPLMKNFIMSYKDLPTKVFQIQNKFRDEKRAKSGLLRGREFIMKDLYSFHADEEDLNQYYEKMKAVYARVYDRAGIGATTYCTFAGGGSFSKYSHEFQTLTPAGEDTIHICDTCKIAVNEEIIADQSSCPQCGNKTLRAEKAIEVGNIFQLKTKYSAPFNLAYADKDGKQHDVVMGCYGMGVQRLMGAIVEVLSDEQGMIWPEAVAPYQFHIVPLFGKDEAANAAVEASMKELIDALQKSGHEALIDDRRDVGAGEKFADSDLIGIPHRVVVSAKTIAAGSFEVKHRANGTVESLDIAAIEKIAAK